MRVLLAAIIAGMIAGAVAGAFQIWRVSPLIIAAEVFENQTDTGAAHTHSHGATEQGAHSHGDTEEAWAPEDGIERTAYTLLANFIMGVAFALIMSAAVMFSGRNITPHNGFVWGVLGFLVFTLAPTAGLAPELPGMPTADLVARQTWWWGTAIATAGGIALIVLAQPTALKALGAGLIALPHLIGAPHPENHESAVPATLAADFAANSVAMMALFWIVLGVSLGWAMTRTQTPVEG
jgi:cobalt transporter subunit CbtA